MEINESDTTEIHENGFISSDDKRPPFKTLLEVREHYGAIHKIMFHENENDGYDFLNERPLSIHLIENFSSTTIHWRLPKY